MASGTALPLRAIGYVQVHGGHIPVPKYIRFSLDDIWDGSRLIQIAQRREFSLSFLTALLLQSDPERLQQ